MGVVNMDEVMSELNNENVEADIDELTDDIDIYEDSEDSEAGDNSEFVIESGDSYQTAESEEEFKELDGVKASESSKETEKTEETEEIKESKESEAEKDIKSDTDDKEKPDFVIPDGASVDGDIEYPGVVIVLGEVDGNIYNSKKVVLDSGLVSSVVGGSVGVFGISIVENEIDPSKTVYISKDSKLTCPGGITADSVVVCEGGIVDTTSIVAKYVEITGAVKGHIAAKKVILHKGAMIKGDIEAGSLTIEEGVAINGSCVQNCRDNIDESVFN